MCASFPLFVLLSFVVVGNLSAAASNFYSAFNVYVDTNGTLEGLQSVTSYPNSGIVAITVFLDIDETLAIQVRVHQALAFVVIKATRLC